MTKVTYPRVRVRSLLTKIALPPSYRIIPARHIRAPLGTAAGDSRFCSKEDSYTVLYAAADFATAFVETVVRDELTHAPQRRIPLVGVTARAWVQLQTKRRTKLQLLDLRKDGCVKLGAPTDAVNARNHAAGRALGRAIHEEHDEVDGLLFSSRLTGADAYAVFDRAINKLSHEADGTLEEHPDLPDVLRKYQIELVRS